ncbi:MAG: ATP-binding protein, partial [Victivallaceae bacterium]
GHIKLKVDFDAITSENGNLTIMVEDTGMGIGEAESKLIFAPFVKVSQRRAGRYIEGTGLGLPIVQRLVEKMNGEISFVSRLNEGTTFKVIIRNLRYEKAVAAAPGQGEGSVVLQDFSRLKVVLVDDVLINLRILGGLLKKMHVEVILCNSGSEAVTYLQHNGADVVLTDVWMPGMNGAELAAQLHTIDGLELLPVVAVSADIELKNNFDTSNFAEILPKPVTFENLKRLFSELFRGQ